MAVTDELAADAQEVLGVHRADKPAVVDHAGVPSVHEIGLPIYAQPITRDLALVLAVADEDGGVVIEDSPGRERPQPVVVILGGESLPERPHQLEEAVSDQSRRRADLVASVHDSRELTRIQHAVARRHRMDAVHQAEAPGT